MSDMLRQYKQCVGCGCEMSVSEPQPCAGCRDDDDPRECASLDLLDAEGREAAP